MKNRMKIAVSLIVLIGIVSILDALLSEAKTRNGVISGTDFTAGYVEYVNQNDGKGNYVGVVPVAVPAKYRVKIKLSNQDEFWCDSYETLFYKSKANQKVSVTYRIGGIFGTKYCSNYVKL